MRQHSAIAQQTRDAGAADLLAVLRTLLAASDGAAPRHPEGARQLHATARAAGEAVLAASEQETREPRRRDALTVRALRAAASVDGFTSEVSNHDARASCFMLACLYSCHRHRMVDFYVRMSLRQPYTTCLDAL